MVLQIAKNFQLVKFSQVDFRIKPPPAFVQTDGAGRNPFRPPFRYETYQQVLILLSVYKTIAKKMKQRYEVFKKTRTSLSQ